MTSGAPELRRLIAYPGNGPVISLYLDLDPERFATAPARASQIRSLLDAAGRRIESDQELDHEQRMGLRTALERIGAFLSSPGDAFKGARALAVFGSGDGLFETVKLGRPADSMVVIEPTPFVEPMIPAVEQPRWLVVLVNRRVAQVFAGASDHLSADVRVDDGVRGQHDKGGWSQANYERSIEKDVDDHLRHIAEIVKRRWQEEGYDRLAIGGPPEIVPRFEELLGDQLRERLAPGRLEVDISSASEAEIRARLDELVAEDEKRAEREALDRLAAGLGAGRRAAGGPADVLDALNERRVALLLLDPDFDGAAKRCPACGMLLLDAVDRCPADGSALVAVDHLGEAAVESALAQDAEVRFVRNYPDLGPHRGIAALLRF